MHYINGSTKRCTATKKNNELLAKHDAPHNRKHIKKLYCNNAMLYSIHVDKKKKTLIT